MLRPLANRPPRAAKTAMALVAMAFWASIAGMSDSNPSLVTWGAMLLCTGGSALLATHWTVAARSLSGGIARSIVGGVVAGWFDALAYSVLTELTQMSCCRHADSMQFLGAFIGLTYGVVFTVPFAAVHGQRAERAPEAADRCMSLLGCWTGLVVLANGAFYSAMSRSRLLDSTCRVAGVAALVGVGSLGIIVILFSLARLVLRRTWVRRVRAGLVARWVVSPLENWRVDELDSVDPLFTTSFSGAVLASISEGEGYRSARRLRPWALVPDE